ncbi:MAG: carboxypeptidase-like regulatory domain-containing protein [Candidatus Acidiferrum sp.]
MRWDLVKRNVLIACVGFLFAVTCGWAQTGTTSLRGVVSDRSGAIVANAAVTLTNISQGLKRETATNNAGEYQFLALPPGTYALTVELAGFRKFEQKNLQLLVNLPSTQNVTLDVGAATETVEVSAEAATLNTTDASLGNAFNENQVKELPLEGRNVPDLLSLQPGVAFPNNRDDDPSFDTRKGAVNGARSDQSNVTVDGVQVNDEGGHAFTSVLPVTLDSVQEFRVTTSNYNADQGSTSGGQVAMVTKSGTNKLHGSAYEYNRNTYTSANDFFVKNGEIQNCLNNGTPLTDPSCNKAPKLIRNIFGGSLGGPIKKDRMYFFANYEGTRRAEATSETNAVPSLAMRDGVIFYQCDHTSSTVATDCPGGSVAGLSGKSYTIPTPVTLSDGTILAYSAVSPQQIKQMDPLHVGPSTVMLNYLNTFPSPNCNNAGDGFNYSCFNFSAPISLTENVYISKLDYNITRDARHRLSLTGALENLSSAGTPFLPGETPSETTVSYNKGLIVNYSGVLTSTLVNNFRYGFIRESVGIIGNSNQDWNYFRGLNDQTGAVTRTHSFQRPIHSFSDDVSWIHGKHTWQFGTQIAIIRTPSVSYQASFSDGSANASWTTLSGYAQKKSPLNPAYTCANSSPSSCTPNGAPFADANFANSYDFPLQALMGMITEVDAQYNFNRDGSALPEGAALRRDYGIDGYEFYGQDTWKVTPTFTATVGLRWSLFSPPWEVNKLQVSPTTSLDAWYHLRANEANNGIPSNNDPPIAFDWSGPANGKPGYYNWDKKDFGPRVALAWSPRPTSGLFHSVLGEGNTAIRAGFGMVYDRFGQGIADDFSQNGSFGLSTQLSNPAGFLSPYNSPRLTSVNTIPTTDLNGNQIFLQAPPAVFPQTYPAGNFAIAHSIDSNLKTPYAYTIDLSVARELSGGFSLEVAYVGRLAHRLLTQLDPATPLDFKDPKTGVDYFTAVTALAKIYRTGLSTDNFNASMVPANVAKYWADVISPLASGDSYATGSCGNVATTSAVVAAYDLFCGNNLNETTGLLVLDYYGLTGTSGNSYLPVGGQYTFYNPQYATLYVWRTMGTSNYNALQADLKHKMSHGVQFDFNYTFSKSIDLSSDAERVGTIGGTGSQIQNAWSPYQFRGVSDFDATHQITANWIVDLPFGRNRFVGRNANRALDAVIGGWQLSGLGRWTSGFPFSVGNGYQWPTNWDLSGNGIKTGAVRTGTFYDPNNEGAVNIFSSLAAAANSFREPLPGEAGQRNNLRGPGFFTVDMDLAKRWKMPWSEGQSLQLRWGVYNVTNSKRFDPLSINGSLDVYGSTFGDFTRLSTKPRVMEFALRYEF